MTRRAAGGLLLAAVLSGATPAGAAPADSLELPTPEAARVQQADLIASVGGRPDRLRASDVPGPVVNDEVVRVGLAGDGTPAVVTADQRLRLTGEGDYAVYERGPARSATSLGDEPPPVTQRGGVVWQGFSPGSRDLAARLVLDPVLEAPRLPLTVAVAFTGEDGGVRALEPGGRVPSAGTVTVTVRNTSSQPQDLPTAVDAPAAALAPLLDRVLAAARRPSGARLPSTDTGLPARLPADGVAQVRSAQAVPLRLTGSLRVRGTTATVEGPATTATADGATLAGTLGASTPSVATTEAVFTVRTDGPGQLLLDLTAVGALNPAELAPPDGLASWSAWAATSPSQQARKAALDLLVAVAATGARASSYSPYLGADLTGSGSTVFRFAFAPPEALPEAVQQLRPRWGHLSLVGLGLLVLLGAAAQVWRRS